MKTIKHFSFAILLAMTTIFTSCTSSDSGSGGFSGPATGSFVKAKAGGSNFSAEGTLATGGYNAGNLVLMGTSMSGKSINIQLYAVGGSLTTGTYNVSSTNTDDNHIGSLSYIEVNTSTFATTTYNSAICDNANGTIVITYVGTDKIEGTFSFVGKELKDGEDCSGGTKNVTNGSFRLEL